MAIQTDGKIIVLGYSHTGAGEDLFLARYNTNGILDATFGNGGIILYNGGGHDRGLGLALQQDGKIVAAGYSYIGNHRDVLVVRYNSDGTPDSSFGRGGVFTYGSSGPATDIGFGVAIEADGRIIVVGETSSGGNQDAFVMCLTPSGSLDKEFGNEGIYTYGNAGLKMDRAFATAIQSDGKIVVTGGSIVNSKDDVLVFRLNRDGTLDTTFGKGGVVLFSSEADNSDYGNWVAVQPDGKIVVNGAITRGSAFDILLLRYNSDGTPDTSFGNNGVVVHGETGGINDYGYAFVIQEDGKLVVTGYSHNGSNDDVIAVRFERDGKVDRSFGMEGTMRWNGQANETDYGQGIALQSDGKLVIAGFSHNGKNEDLLIMRLNP